MHCQIPLGSKRTVVRTARGVSQCSKPAKSSRSSKDKSSCRAVSAVEDAQRKKVSFVNLGCPKNTVDGEVLLGDLHRSGFQISDEHENTDAIIINTCAFVDDAKAESLQAILEAAELKQEGQTKRVIVTGCLAQRYSNSLAEDIPEADLVMGFQNYAQLPKSLQGLLGVEPPTDPFTPLDNQRVQVGEATVPFRAEWDRHRLTPKHTAYLRIAEGCSHACSFCAIPHWRGKFRSKPWGAVLEEAKHLVAVGAKELNLIAEDTNQWGMDRKDGLGLAQLLKELAKLEGLHWMRLLYCYPSYFTEELINEIALNPKVCKYIDIPLQHINNLTLLGMNRPPRGHTESLLRKLRARIPDLALRTTFISGFPGESEESHRELVEFCRDFKFERMGCFAYSEEEGTPAAVSQDQVATEVRQARRDELVSLQQDIGQEFAISLIGREVPVLIDSISEDGELTGRTQWDAPDVDPIVFLDISNNSPEGLPEIGEVWQCHITGASLFDLDAYPIRLLKN